jgi:outer membrane biosynthesis protein TonB
VPSGPSGSSAALFPAQSYSPSQASIVVAPPPPQQKRGVPLWFWPVLLFTAVFGVSAAVFVFRQPAPPAPVVIQMPATAPTATEAKVDVPPPAPSAEPTTSASAPTGKVAAATGPKAGGNPATTPEKKGIDLGGLVPGAGGPNVGGGAGAGAGGGAGLDSSSVERVVASHRAGVKRTCWERGGADQKSSVNVMVSATVAPDGSVSGTSSSGDDPVVAKCIEGQVRSWRFNAPGSTTTVNIPFKFVRQ